MYQPAASFCLGHIRLFVFHYICIFYISWHINTDCNGIFPLKQDETHMHTHKAPPTEHTKFIWILCEIWKDDEMMSSRKYYHGTLVDGGWVSLGVWMGFFFFSFPLFFLHIFNVFHFLYRLDISGMLFIPILNPMLHHIESNHHP